MSNDAFFWLGELGIILTIISGIMLMYQLRHQSFWFVIPIWFVVYCFSVLLVHPINSLPTVQGMPEIIYLTRLSIGVCFSVRAWYWNSGANKPTNAADLAVTRNILRVGIIAASMFISYMFYKLKNSGK